MADIIKYAPHIITGFEFRLLYFQTICNYSKSVQRSGYHQKSSPGRYTERRFFLWEIEIGTSSLHNVAV